MTRPWPALLTLLLGGCASVGPDYQTPAVPVPEDWQSHAAGTLTGGLQADAGWWLQLGDPALSGLIEQALRANPDLDAARAALREARARRRIALAGRAPEIGGSAAARRTLRSATPPSDLFNASIDAGWEVDVFGGVQRAIEAAQADYAAAAAGLDDVRVSVAAEVALNYIALRTYQNRLAIAQVNLASQTETLQLTDWRVQAGMASAVDLEQARSNREQTAAQIPSLQTGRSEAEYALAVLLGRAPGNLGPLLDRAAGMPQIPAVIALGIPAETLRQRPDIRAAEARLAAETARTGVAIANRYPAFRLSGSIGVEALTAGGLFGAETLARSLLASVSAPLLDGGRLRAQAEAQQAVQDQALAAYRTALLNALLEVENALLELNSGHLREQALARAATAARAASQLARQRYQGGLIDFQTVLDTDRSRLAAEDALASVRSDRMTALVRLYKALGGGWSHQARSGQEP